MCFKGDTALTQSVYRGRYVHRIIEEALLLEKGQIAEHHYTNLFLSSCAAQGRTECSGVSFPGPNRLKRLIGHENTSTDQTAFFIFRM